VPPNRALSPWSRSLQACSGTRPSYREPAVQAESGGLTLQGSGNCPPDSGTRAPGTAPGRRASASCHWHQTPARATTEPVRPGVGPGAHPTPHGTCCVNSKDECGSSTANRARCHHHERAPHAPPPAPAQPAGHHYQRQRSTQALHTMRTSLSVCTRSGVECSSNNAWYLRPAAWMPCNWCRQVGGVQGGGAAQAAKGCRSNGC